MSKLRTRITVDLDVDEAEALREYCDRHEIGYVELLKQLITERTNQPHIQIGWPTAVFAGEASTGQWWTKEAV